MQQTELDTQRALGRVIDARRAEIERRWLERVRQDIAKQAGIELTQLRDGIPDYLSAIAKGLPAGPADTLRARGHEAWSLVAKEHGITRVRIGFNVDQLVREFIVLRQVLRDAVLDAGIATQSLLPLTDIIEVAIATAVAAYTQARDY